MSEKRTKYVPWFLRLLPVLVCVFLVLIIYYPVFFRGYWAVNRSDALHIHLPNNHLVAKAFLQGRFPLWNPNFNLGQPIIDGFTQIFHPGLIFYLLFNPWLANTAEILFGLFLTCLGIWFLLQQLGLGIFPTIIGTLVYVLSGPVFFLHSYHMGFMAILLLPWCLWVFHRHDQTGHSKWLWIGAILCIFAIHSPDYDTLFYLYISFVIDRLICLPLRGRRLYITIWMSIFLLSALTGLLSYLPVYEWVIHSSRATKTYLGVFTPDLSNILTAIFTNQWLRKWPYDVFYFYFGPATIWLVLAGSVTFKKVTYTCRYFLWSLTIPAFYIIKLFLQQIDSLTFLTALESWRSMFVFCLGLAMMAAIGVRNVLQGQRFQRWLALLFGFLTIVLTGWTIYSGMYVFRKYIVLLIAGAGILITIFPMSKKAIIFRLIGISVAVGATLMVSAIIHTTGNRFCVISSKSSIIKKLSFYRALAKTPDGQEGHWRISIFGPTDNTTSLVGLKTLPNYTSIYNKEMEDSLCLDGLINRDYRLPYWMRLDKPDAYALSTYGVRFLVALDGLLSEKNSIGWFKRPDLSWYHYSVWENKYYIGRAYIVEPSGERRGGVEFLQDTPVTIVLQTEVEDGDRLVLADLNYPGWEASMDGKRTPTEVYHGCLRSVRLSKGMHLVSWRYTARIQRVGMILSAIALIFLLCFLIILSNGRKYCKDYNEGTF